MRKMHPIIVDCVHRCQDALHKIVLDRQTNEIELKKMLGKLTMDVIATCAFSTRIDVYNEWKTDPFIENTNELITPSPIKTIFFILFSLSSRFAHFFTKTFHSPIWDFYRSAVSSTFRRLIQRN